MGPRPHCESRGELGVTTPWRRQVPTRALEPRPENYTQVPVGPPRLSISAAWPREEAV
jgi:hypothetical protein